MTDTCTATYTLRLGPEDTTFQCIQPAGHYGNPDPWHRSAPHPKAGDFVWNDNTGGATPHDPAVPSTDTED